MLSAISKKFSRKEYETVKMDLLHGREKRAGVEEAAEPERVWSAVEAPRAKLVVTVVEFTQPVSQTAARLPRYLYVHDTDTGHGYLQR